MVYLGAHSMFDLQNLRDLKIAFWPFQLDNTESLFLRAAHAANCSDGSNNVEERYFDSLQCCNPTCTYIYVYQLLTSSQLHTFSSIAAPAFFFPLSLIVMSCLCSAFNLASAKAARHRLERGVWTSVRFGDMRRALSGM